MSGEDDSIRLPNRNNIPMEIKNYSVHTSIIRCCYQCFLLFCVSFGKRCLSDRLYQVAEKQVPISVPGCFLGYNGWGGGSAEE